MAGRPGLLPSQKHSQQNPVLPRGAANHCVASPPPVCRETQRPPTIVPRMTGERTLAVGSSVTIHSGWPPLSLHSKVGERGSAEGACRGCGPRTTLNRTGLGVAVDGSGGLWAPGEGDQPFLPTCTCAPPSGAPGVRDPGHLLPSQARGTRNSAAFPLRPTRLRENLPGNSLGERARWDTREAQAKVVSARRKSRRHWPWPWPWPRSPGRL